MGLLPEAPARSKETVTWETRLEVTVMAELLDCLERIGIRPRTRSALLRNIAYALRDLLVEHGIELVRFNSYESALERLSRSGIVNLNDPRSFSSKPAMRLTAALSSEDGTPSRNGSTIGFSNLLRNIGNGVEKKPTNYSSLGTDAEVLRQVEEYNWIEDNKKASEEAEAKRIATFVPAAFDPELAKTIAIRRRWRSEAKVTNFTVKEQEAGHACNEQRKELGREPLDVIAYVLCLQKGYNPLNIVDADEVFWELREYNNPDNAAKYVDIEAVPKQRELTREEMKAQMLANNAKMAAKAAKKLQMEAIKAEEMQERRSV